MRTSTARRLHLALFLIGVLLYVVFVLPRWWVLTGDIPSTLATAGRIAAGIPIALAAWPVMQLLQAGLRTKPPAPEFALRLRAWSGVLHVVAGVLILLGALVEIWLSLEVGGPYLFGVYGAAGAIAILGFLALYLSFVAEKPPAEPKPAKPKKDKRVKTERVKAEKRPRGKKKAAEDSVAGTVTNAEAADEPAEEATQETAPATETLVEEAAEAAVAEAVVSETVVSETVVTETADAEPTASGLRNKRPVGKRRFRPSRDA